jgi:DNA-binding CsgD family transcriptional regulator
MQQQELSPVAVIVLGYLTRATSRLNVVQLSAGARIPLATAQAAVEELVGARRVRVAAGGGLILLRPSEPDLTVSQPAGTAGRDERARQRWRIEDLLSREQPARDDSVEPIHGMSATVARIATSFRSRPQEVLALSPPPAVKVMQALDAPARKANLEMLAKGTRSVWVLDESRLAAPSWRSHIERLQNAGEEVYAAPDVSQRLIILDRRIAYVPLDPADHTRGSMLIDSAPLVAGLVALFHEVLDRASRVSGTRTVSQIRHAILSMLAVGSKDEAIARKLDVSTRTVRRAVAAMMEECGAENRFQLAVAAVRLGWLTAEDLAQGSHPALGEEAPME